MRELIKKSLRIAVWFGAVAFLFSFFYGGVYNEMYVEALGFTFTNFLYAFIGAVAAGAIITFHATWIILVIKLMLNKIKKK